MSRRYQTKVTVTVDGDEHDALIRAHVTVDGQGATIDGDIEVQRWGAWEPLTGVTPRDMERAEDSLCEMALEDDRDQCIEMYEDGTVGL